MIETSKTNALSTIEKQTSEYLKIKKDQEEARKIAKEQEALANRPWYEKALDYGGNIVNELTGVNDAKRAATGVDPITGEELTAGQRVAAGGMAAAGYIPIVGWAGRIFKGGKAVYKTTQATSAAVRAVDIYKTSQKSFDALKTSQKGLYGITATNGFSEAITGRDMFGNKISKEQQEASMNAALTMLLPFGSKGFQGKMGVKGAGKSTDIPSVRNKEFNKWFDKLSVDEFEKAWNVPALRSKIEDRIRQPGGYHEWHLVARTPQFKKWDVSMDRIKELRTLTKDVEFVNPPGQHGGRGSTKAHNEILKIIDNAPDYESFVRELNEWASKRMKNGVQDLPEGLRR